MRLPQEANNLKNSGNSSESYYLPSSSSYWQSDSYSSSGCHYILAPRVKTNRRVDIATNPIDYHHQVPFSDRESFQKSVVSQLANGSSNSRCSSVSIYSLVNNTYSPSDTNSSEALGNLLDDQLTTHHIEDSDLEVKSGMKIDRNRSIETLPKIISKSLISDELTDEVEFDINTSDIELSGNWGDDLQYDRITLSSSSSHLLYDMLSTDDWERISCCSNYSGATNTTYSINTNLLSSSDFPTSDD